MDFTDDQGAAGPGSGQGFVQSRPFPLLPVTPWSPLIRSLGRRDPQARTLLRYGTALSPQKGNDPRPSH